MSAIDEAEPFRIERPFFGPIRALLGAAGLFCIVVPAWELFASLRSISVWTVFIGAIVGVAWSIGIPLLIQAIMGDSETWTFRDGALEVERTSPWRRTRSEIIKGSDIARTEIRMIEWDSRPDNFRVLLHLRSGKRLETPDYGTHAKASEIRDEIRRNLAMAEEE